MQRVIGAVILISLVVIFLPMLLDGTGEERQRLVTERPSPPHIDLEAVTVEEITAKMEQMERESEAALPREVVDGTDYGEAQDFTLDKNNLPVAWSLQLASFSNKENAVKLRAKLREENFRAYVLVNRRNGEALFQVFVGPMASKASLAEIGSRIKASMNLEGWLVRYEIARDDSQLGG